MLCLHCKVSSGAAYLKCSGNIFYLNFVVRDHKVQVEYLNVHIMGVRTLLNKLNMLSSVKRFAHNVTTVHQVFKRSMRIVEGWKRPQLFKLLMRV